MTPLTEDDMCETTSQVLAISDAEEVLSEKHDRSTGAMKAYHQTFRKTLQELDLDPVSD